MLYIIENNGVYGLTKGQFSASADVGTKAKKGEANFQPPIDPVLLAMTLGASFVARSFSGDKEQLVPLIQAGLKHKGFALIDVLSPVRHLQRSRRLDQELRLHPRALRAGRACGLHPVRARDQGAVQGRRVAAGDDARRQPHRAAQARCEPTTRRIASLAATQIQERMKAGEYLTGLLFVEAGAEGVPRGERHARGAAQQHSLRDAVAGLEEPREDPRALSLIELAIVEMQRPGALARRPAFNSLERTAITSDADRRRHHRDLHHRHHRRHRHRRPCAPELH